MFNFTPAVRFLLVTNLVILLLEDRLPIERFALYHFTSPYFQPWQLVTYMFLHSGWAHLIGNMFGLLFLGSTLEQRWGTARFLVFYFVCGIGAGVLYDVIRAWEVMPVMAAIEEFKRNPTALGLANVVRPYVDISQLKTLIAGLKEAPPDPGAVRIATELVDKIRVSFDISSMRGASGSVFGVLFAFGYLFPNTELLLFPLPVPVKAKYYVFAYGAYELWSEIHRSAGDNVAHFAHLSGMLIAFLLLKYWERSRTDFY